MRMIQIFQIVVAILLIGVVLLQNQGTGLGPAWGGGSESYHTKRGLEKVVFTATIILTIIFTVLSLVALTN